MTSSTAPDPRRDCRSFPDISVRSRWPRTRRRARWSGSQSALVLETEGGRFSSLLNRRAERAVLRIELRGIRHIETADGSAVLGPQLRKMCRAYGLRIGC